ncbi:MAG TPA: SMC-Scp complex subunit ScpB [Candidatus Paceibacterota bacterium]|nr:SMC-Scp complex subunit ScpB [Candidatus Paceibacterota bacterium]
MTNQLPQSIEAILFATSEPQTFASLASRLNVSESHVKEALESLRGSLEGHGIVLIIHDNSATLATRPEEAKLIEDIRREELQKELSKASAETLAVIMYHPGATRLEIEFIRGVNVSYSLRSLQIRGLVEQRGSGRSVAYFPTVALLEHFGASSAEALPNFIETKQKIDALMDRSEAVETQESPS